MTATTEAPTEPGAGTQYDPVLERAVLGALLVAGEQDDREVPGRIIGLLRGERDFYDPRHQMIYRKIVELVEQQQAPHPVTVMTTLSTAELSRTDNGGYITDCYGVGQPEQGAYHAGILRQWAAKRETVQSALKAYQRAIAAPVGDIAEVQRSIQDDIGKLQVSSVRTALVNQAQTNDEALEYIDLQSQRDPDEISGVQSGFIDLDRLLKGGQPGQVCVVAGRPGMGKSTLARNYVWNAAVRQGVPAAFWSLEMSRMEIGLAMLSADSGVPLNALRDGQLDERMWDRLSTTIGRSQHAPLYYDETPGATLHHMREGLRHVTQLHGSCDIAAFDYLQLSPSTGNSGSRQQDVAEISRGVKLLAKEFGTFIILVSQLNRGPEQRTDKRPQLGDLRESGSIEQDADIVILLHREDYYDKESPRAGEADFIVAKHRNGPTDTLTMSAQLHLSRFISMAID